MIKEFICNMIAVTCIAGTLYAYMLIGQMLGY